MAFSGNQCILATSLIVVAFGKHIPWPNTIYDSVHVGEKQSSPAEAGAGLFFPLSLSAAPPRQPTD